ncbi:DUF262 domain-containing protein [Flavobacterium muglaense]|uniref:DUF262 domain-containing protein n=1 Tax=Flavobacterium muglaense TaxID=2764716 RepID=A0A923SFC1_9FLAO|nr:DUF262 domain-containing protein [Flavobacterium muglaense]MBC5837806.1 DUF262 domain-containing protein [Flavobacterium muglaense]MBC5844436.1 DUF262 domain-containing protein [Flavobacterium muglaense]
MISPLKQIESGKMFIQNVFGNYNNHEMWYKIPEYQRPYVWEDDQVIALLEDIASAQQFTQDSEYFLGSIVFHSKLSENKQYRDNELLDGQQRLTTLYMLMAIIRDLSEDEDLKKTCRDAIFQKENKFKGIPERMRLTFDIRDEVKDFAEEYIKIDGSTLRKEQLLSLIANGLDINIKNMAKAIITMREWFLKNQAVNVEDFFIHLMNNVLLIFVSSQELDDAFRLFTVLNDRGVKLRNSDILKAENLKFVDDDAKRKNYAVFWEELEGELQEDFDQFLSYIRTILVKDKARLSLLKEFEQNIYFPKEYIRETKQSIPKKPLLTKGVDTFEYIKKYKRHYDFLFNNANSSIGSTFEFENLIALLQDNSIADIWIPPVLCFRESFGDSEIFKFLKKLDNKFSADLIAGESPTYRIESMNNIIKEIEAVKNNSNILPEDKISALLSSDIFNFNQIAFLNEIQTGQIYKRKFARYILLKLDYLNSGNTQKWNTPSKISIEHVLPQNPALNSQWNKDFTVDQKNEWLNRLGNLVLISRVKNSSLSNLDYEAKKKKYFDTKMDVFPNSLKMIQSKEWTLETLKTNHKRVIDQLKLHYDIK